MLLLLPAEGGLLTGPTTAYPAAPRSAAERATEGSLAALRGGRGRQRSAWQQRSAIRQAWYRRPGRWLKRWLTGLQDAALAPLLRLLEASARRRTISRMPKRIILVRLGESEGNVDKALYEHVPDSLIGLTATGFDQGVQCGRRLCRLLASESVHFYYSPYMRTRQTLRAILKSFNGLDLLVTCEPRLRECDFGNFQNASEMAVILAERQRFGRFYFRFPNGEAVTDVYDRVNDFWQDMAQQSAEGGPHAVVDNVVLVTHGLLMRTFCMSYLGWTPSEFEQVWVRHGGHRSSNPQVALRYASRLVWLTCRPPPWQNPSNCEMWLLELSSGGEYRLSGRLEFCSDAADARAELTEIRFGVNQSEALPEHMRRPAASRWMQPCAPEALDSPHFTHLRVPGPRTQAALRRDRGTYCESTLKRQE